MLGKNLNINLQLKKLSGIDDKDDEDDIKPRR